LLAGDHVAKACVARVDAPESLVTVVRTAPVSALVSVTVAPGNAAALPPPPHAASD